MAMASFWLTSAFSVFGPLVVGMRHAHFCLLLRAPLCPWAGRCFAHDSCILVSMRIFGSTVSVIICHCLGSHVLFVDAHFELILTLLSSCTLHWLAVGRRISSCWISWRFYSKFLGIVSRLHRTASCALASYCVLSSGALASYCVLSHGALLALLHDCCIE